MHAVHEIRKIQRCLERAVQVGAVLRRADEDQRIRGILPDDRDDLFRVASDILPARRTVWLIADLIDQARLIPIALRKL